MCISLCSLVWPGVCEDDADARIKRLAKNLTGFEVTSARGTGQCTCSQPFFGHGCQEGQCPAGERLVGHAKVDMATYKYSQWEICMPCESGKFKKFSGNKECSLCPGGHVSLNRTSCCHLVLQALSHLESTLRTARLVLKALSLQRVPQVARRAKLELRQIKAEALVSLAKLELLQGRPSRS